MAMDWSTLLDSGRLGESAASKHAKDIRTEFERDADRILFSGPFRRLSRKTQVHPLAANDHVHTRLTHSLETGQVGRSLARYVYDRIVSDLPSDISAESFGSIVRAACLAHDIGNPPFGHAGEEALAHWFESNPSPFKSLPKAQRTDLGYFDGNAQGFRILTQTENYVFDGGMRLTYATLGTFLKYPHIPTPGMDKASAFLSEKDILDEVATRLGLPSNAKGYARHPLAYLVEAADDICYCVLDIEDAVELRIVTFEEAFALFKPLLEDRAETLSTMKGFEQFRVNFTRLRGAIFHALIDGATESFVANYTEIMKGTGPKDLFGALDSSDPRRMFIGAAKALGRSRIYRDVKKVEIELGAFATLDVLLTELLAAAGECAVNPDLADGALTWKSKSLIGLLGDHAPRKANAPNSAGWTPYLSYRRAIDFVSGMTDNYATYLAKQLRGMAFAGVQRP